MVELRYVQGATESRKRAIQKFTSERVTLNNGVLYYSESNSESEKINRQWIQNKELKEQILQTIAWEAVTLAETKHAKKYAPGIFGMAFVKTLTSTSRRVRHVKR